MSNYFYPKINLSSIMLQIPSVIQISSTFADIDKLSRSIYIFKKLRFVKNFLADRSSNNVQRKWESFSHKSIRGKEGHKMKSNLINQMIPDVVILLLRWLSITRVVRRWLSITRVVRRQQFLTRVVRRQQFITRVVRCTGWASRIRPMQWNDIITIT